jgi:hypothetical protein
MIVADCGYWEVEVSVLKRVSQGAGKGKYSLAARSVLLRTAARDANGGVGSPQAAGTLLLVQGSFFRCPE